MRPVRAAESRKQENIREPESGAYGYCGPHRNWSPKKQIPNYQRGCQPDGPGEQDAGDCGYWINCHFQDSLKQ
jgi:hypothetical protein